VSEKKSSTTFGGSELYEQLLNRIDFQFKGGKQGLPILEWAKKLQLASGPFQVEGHEYQIDMLTEKAPRQCSMKGAQQGSTEIANIRTLYGMSSGRYPQGALYLFPSVDTVTDFSRARFAPLLSENPEIGRQVTSTDTVGIKRIGRSTLYFRGARATGRIENIKKTSAALKGIPVDLVVFDEVDEIEPSMIDLALERLAHSKVKEEVYLSTPSIPNYGIDKLYADSDQRIWLIRCEACGAETCLEIEFPSILLQMQDGRVIRACKKCQREIFPRNGHWVARYPERSKDMVGWWISQLNSTYVDPGSILRAFNDPPHGNIAEVYNSKLAQAYISAEDKLTVQDIYSCCFQNPMLAKFQGPACAGIDVGAKLHVVVGYRRSEKVFEVCYAARVSSFNDLHDICQRFGVKVAVIDLEPETRQVHQWQAAESFPIFGCDYIDSIQAGPQWNEQQKVLKVNRTESLDALHNRITSSMIQFPRRSEEVEELARELTNICKVLEEDENGGRSFKYRKTGPDHYAHALSYALLAANRIPVFEDDSPGAWARRMLQDKNNNGDYDALSYGLKGVCK
jgi:hypothetical protein